MELNNNQEKPLYVLPQVKKRIIIPKTIVLILLGVVFYLGILLNVSLLKINSTQESYTKIISIIIVLSIVVLGVYINIHNSNKKYIFYKDRLVKGKKSISYNEIKNITPKISLLDKIFKTYHIELNKKFSLSNITQEVPLQNYLQQLIDYTKKNQ
jgi:hypothetical protein